MQRYREKFLIWNISFDLFTTLFLHSLIKRVPNLYTKDTFEIIRFRNNNNIIFKMFKLYNVRTEKLIFEFEMNLNLKINIFSKISI